VSSRVIAEDEATMAELDFEEGRSFALVVRIRVISGETRGSCSSVEEITERI